MNCRMILLARTALGMTQQELADAAGISQSTISKVESGLMTLEDNQVESLARALRIPRTFLDLPDRAHGLPISYRRRKSIGQRELAKLEARLNIVRIRVLQIVRLSPPDPVIPLPSLDIEEFGSPEEVARMARRHFRLPRGPVENVTQVIEDAGVFVFAVDFETMAVDALSIIMPSEPPFIFVNTRFPGDRLRFTLTHELGHLIMHAGNMRPDMETEADRFAAEFLVPEDEIRPQLVAFTLTKLLTLKRYWKVSMHALVYRAAELDVITSRTSQRWYQRLSQYRRTGEPAPIPPEKPTLIFELTTMYREELNYSEQELAAVLHAHVEDLYGVFIARPYLRLLTA